MTMEYPRSCLCQLILLCVTLTTAAGGGGAPPRVIDITHVTHNGMPVWGSATGAGQAINESYGDEMVVGAYRLGTHVGTHVDAPDHVKSLVKPGRNVPGLDLHALIGPVLVVRVPGGVNITEKALSSLNLPKGLERVIFKTKNTDRRLMYQQAFAPDYTAFTQDGAKWLVENTKIKFTGIDYMSIAISDQIVPVHETLLSKTGLVVVEGLKLDDVKPGRYYVYCLPMKLMAEAAPTRCILM